MKKLVLGVAMMSLFVSCKKIQAGANHGVLKMEEGAERYSDDQMKDAVHAAKDTAATTVATDSAGAAKLPANTLDQTVKTKPATDTAPQHSL